MFHDFKMEPNRKADDHVSVHRRKILLLALYAVCVCFCFFTFTPSHLLLTHKANQPEVERF